MSNFGNDKCKEIVENVCPYCNAHLLVNKRSFANHIRWCKANPNYETIYTSTISKLKNRVFISKKQNYTCNCIVCNNEYTIYITPHLYKIGKYKKTCSDKCAKQLTAQKTNKEIKLKKIKEKLPKINRHYCKNCNKEISNNKSFCSIDCKLLYKLKNKTQKQIYKYFCKFTFALNDFPNEFNFDLIKQYGWYKAKNRGDNLLGVSRDHKYSCEDGFKNSIDPYLISHPANCEIMQHIKNSSKCSKCSITLDDLKKNVLNWNKKYGEYPNKINYTLLKDITKYEF